VDTMDPLFGAAVLSPMFRAFIRPPRDAITVAFFCANRMHNVSSSCWNFALARDRKGPRCVRRLHGRLRPHSGLCRQGLCKDQGAQARRAHEPGLQDLVHTNPLERPCALPKPLFITAGTPSRQGDGNADLSYVYDVAREIARALKNSPLPLPSLRSPVGAGDEAEGIIKDARPDADFAVASNP
jgi:hypothetical protein